MCTYRTTRHTYDVTLSLAMTSSLTPMTSRRTVIRHVTVPLPSAEHPFGQVPSPRYRGHRVLAPLELHQPPVIGGQLRGRWR